LSTAKRLWASESRRAAGAVHVAGTARQPGEIGKGVLDLTEKPSRLSQQNRQRYVSIGIYPLYIGAFARFHNVHTEIIFTTARPKRKKFLRRANGSKKKFALERFGRVV